MDYEKGLPAGRQGFTLVELLIVIAIIGILSSVTVAQFITAKKKANDVSRKSDLNGISKSLQMYFTDFGVFPDASADGKMIVGGTTKDWGGEFNDSTGYVYMKVLPRENSLTGFPYCYKIDTDKKKFAIFAQLENVEDKECKDHAYSCGDGGSLYCFAYVSPNTSLDSNGNLQ